MFVTNIFDEDQANVIAIGLEYCEECEEFLNSIEFASECVECFDGDKKKNLLENVRIFYKKQRVKDLQEVSSIVKEIRDKGKVPLLLDRGHLPSYFSIKALECDKILVFDAHCDLKSKYVPELIEFDVWREPEKFNGGTWLRRLSEVVEPEKIILFGVRSFDEDEFKYMKEKGITFFTPRMIKKGKALSVLRQIEGEVYISLDMDVFDPSIAPAVDYPEPGGIDFFDFQDILENIDAKVIGCDVCCIKPIKGNLVTEFLAVRSIFEMLSKI